MTLRSKLFALVAVAAISLGAAGFASSASAALPGAGLNTTATDTSTTGPTVQDIGHTFFWYGGGGYNDPIRVP